VAVAGVAIFPGISLRHLWIEITTSSSRFARRYEEFRLRALGHYLWLRNMVSA